MRTASVHNFSAHSKLNIGAQEFKNVKVVTTFISDFKEKNVTPPSGPVCAPSPRHHLVPPSPSLPRHHLAVHHPRGTISPCTIPAVPSRRVPSRRAPSPVLSHDNCKITNILDFYPPYIYLSR